MGYRPPFLIVTKLASSVKLYPPQSSTGDDLIIYPNTTDTNYIALYGNGKIELVTGSNAPIDIKLGGNSAISLNYENAGGIIYFDEVTGAPTAKSNYGAIYTKNDNNLYFQDGAGTEHTVAFV